MITNAIKNIFMKITLNRSKGFRKISRALGSVGVPTDAALQIPAKIVKSITEYKNDKMM